jgi:hypothetical protein
MCVQLAKQYERHEAHAIALIMVEERIWRRAPPPKVLAAFDHLGDCAANAMGGRGRDCSSRLGQ